MWFRNELSSLAKVSLYKKYFTLGKKGVASYKTRGSPQNRSRRPRWRVEVQLFSFFLIFAPGWDGWLTPRSCHFALWKDTRYPYSCRADNLPPSCAVVTKSGNINFLEPSGPLRAYNGTALPLPLFIGRSVGPKAGLDGCEKSRLHQDSTPRPSSS